MSAAPANQPSQADMAMAAMSAEVSQGRYTALIVATVISILPAFFYKINYKSYEALIPIIVLIITSYIIIMLSSQAYLSFMMSGGRGVENEQELEQPNLMVEGVIYSIVSAILFFMWLIGIINVSRIGMEGTRSRAVFDSMNPFSSMFGRRRRTKRV